MVFTCAGLVGRVSNGVPGSLQLLVHGLQFSICVSFTSNVADEPKIQNEAFARYHRKRKKEKDLTKSYDKSLYTNRKFRKAK